jgi:hypothetical protein
MNGWWRLDDAAENTAPELAGPGAKDYAVRVGRLPRVHHVVVEY